MLSVGIDDAIESFCKKSPGHSTRNATCLTSLKRIQGDVVYLNKAIPFLNGIVQRSMGKIAEILTAVNSDIIVPMEILHEHLLRGVSKDCFFGNEFTPTQQIINTAGKELLVRMKDEHGTKTA